MQADLSKYLSNLEALTVVKQLLQTTYVPACAVSARLPFVKLTELGSSTLAFCLKTVTSILLPPTSSRF